MYGKKTAVRDVNTNTDFNSKANFEGPVIWYKVYFQTKWRKQIYLKRYFGKLAKMYIKAE